LTDLPNGIVAGVSPPAPVPSLGEATSHRLRAAARWRLSKLRRELLNRIAPDLLGPQLAAWRVRVDAEVVLYYPDSPERAYQIEQWLPVMEQLHEKHPVVIVLREMSALRHLQERTTLPLVCVKSLADMMTLYDMSDYKVCIYVNNSYRNFHSLNNPRVLHVHVNHGESDKLSSFSNQVKAYDRVFVAGDVAVERYREALINFDEAKVVPVGRPQLDLTFAPELAESSRRTVMYAPTWEGESESNNWTSLDKFGVSIVEQALALPDVRVIYKPHPRVPGSKKPGVAEAHNRITALIKEAAARDPEAGHATRMTGNILAMFDRVDALVGDVSSVTLDYLYLRPDCPIFLTDRRNNRSLLERDAPLTAGSDIVDATSLPEFGATLGGRLADDARREDRHKVRHHYFGDLGPGDSSKRFQAAVAELIEKRDQLLAGHRRVTTGDVDEHS
jgi:hypothetical protein